MKEKILFITGKPRSGKSTLVKRIIEKLPSRRISGIITPEFREGEIRKGFLIQDLRSGGEEILASVDIKSEQRVGKYGVNVDGINRIVDKFLESFKEADLIVLDELGIMELKSSKFREMIERVLESKKPCLITLHRNLVEKYKDRGEIFWLKRENFEEVEEEIMRRLLSL